MARQVPSTSTRRPATPWSTLAVLCVDVDAHGEAAGNRESGLVYDATSRALRGTMHCP